MNIHTVPAVATATCEEVDGSFVPTLTLGGFSAFVPEYGVNLSQRTIFAALVIVAAKIEELLAGSPEHGIVNIDENETRVTVDVLKAGEAGRETAARIMQILFRVADICNGDPLQFPLDGSEVAS